MDSDIAGEDGYVLAEGPSLELVGKVTENSHNNEIDKWFDDFETMLVDKYDYVLKALKNLE